VTTELTDTATRLGHVPSRLGTTLELVDGRMVAFLTPSPALCPRGTLSMASAVLLVDALTGYSVDADDDVWALTSDISVRLPLLPPPSRIDATVVELRGGSRSATFETNLVADGQPWGTAFARFAKVPRRAEDAAKPPLDRDRAAARGTREPLDEPLRDVAGFESREPAGVVAVALRKGLLNVAGGLQGAIAAGLAEAAAEDLADHVLGHDPVYVVTELEIRYLTESRRSPIVATARFVGPPAEGLVRIDLVDDDGRGTLTTTVSARLRPVPA